MKRHIASLVFLVILFSGCGGSDDSSDSENAGPSKTTVELGQAVAPGGCLSAPLYLEQVRALNPALRVLQISKRIDYSAKNGVRHNFELTNSLGTFQFETAGIGVLQQPVNIIQNDCESFTVTDPEGTAEVYQIKEKTRESVTGVAESGRRLSYRFVSPTQMEITTRYITYDVPCGSELKPIFVEQTKLFDWSQQVPERIPLGSMLAVDRSYLERIAEATGKSIGDFYTTETDSVGNTSEALVTEQLRSVPTLTPRPEILICNGTPEEPPPGPPEDGEEEGENGGGEGGETEPLPPAPPAPPAPPEDGGGIIIPPFLRA